MIELNKEKVIAVALGNTIELLEPFIREQEPDITQQKINDLMNLMTAYPQLMENAKVVARDYYFKKFHVCIVWNRDKTIKKLY